MTALTPNQRAQAITKVVRQTKSLHAACPDGVAISLRKTQVGVLLGAIADRDRLLIDLIHAHWPSHEQPDAPIEPCNLCIRWRELTGTMPE